MKLNIWIGWISILLAILSLVPSIVPGAMSIFGLLISLIALIISVFSVRKQTSQYFLSTITIVIVGLFLVNDGLRIWDPLEMPITFKLVLYSIFLIVVVCCVLVVRKTINNTQSS